MRSVEEGHYARKQLGSRSSIIRWSHAARFQQGVRLAESRPTEKLLDYGCGDGTFLSLMSDKFRACVGADIEPEQVDDCRRRFATVPNVTFCLVEELNRTEHTRSYGVVTCMETLEHCTDSTVDSVLADLDRLCTRDGTVVISVPIETGPVFVLKYLVRKLAVWRGLSEYARYETYTWSDTVRMLFATERTVLHRPVYGDPRLPYHSHYGFNWRRFRTRVAEVFGIERVLFTPMGLSRGWFSSQVWFVCRPR
jgi:ubiquinone/menaquinone biosynthesis C-methylase UbiE